MTHDANSARTESRAQSHFWTAPVGAGEEKPGNVGASDEEDDSNRSEQKRQRGTDIGDCFVQQWIDCHAEAVAILGIPLCKSKLDCVQFGEGLLDAVARLEAPDDGEAFVVAKRSDRSMTFGIDCVSRPEKGWLGDGVVETRGHDSDDDVRFIADLHRLTKRVGRRSKVRDPEFVAKNGDAVTWLFLFSGEGAAERWSYAEQ